MRLRSPARRGPLILLAALLGSPAIAQQSGAPAGGSAPFSKERALAELQAAGVTRAQLIDLGDRFSHAGATSDRDPDAGCLELGRLFDDTNDSEVMRKALPIVAKGLEPLEAEWKKSGFLDHLQQLETEHAYGAACGVAYLQALFAQARGASLEREAAMMHARANLAHLAERAASKTPAAASAARSSASPTSAAPSEGAAELTRAVQDPGVRVALLVANAQYQAGVAPLRTPAADVALIAAGLRRAGFSEVIVVQNATRSQMVDALRRFQDKADHADTALIYYAGHGLQSQGENYALPVDARLSDERSLGDEAVSQGRLMEAMARTGKLKILVMDACRDNPFLATMASDHGSRGITRGLARIVPPKSHTVVVYSAASGQQALDGDGANSPFASALGRRMLEPGVEVDMVLRRVNDDVIKSTDGAQEPNIAGNLGADPFFFIPPARG